MINFFAYATPLPIQAGSFKRQFKALLLPSLHLPLSVFLVCSHPKVSASLDLVVLELCACSCLGPCLAFWIYCMVLVPWFWPLVLALQFWSPGPSGPGFIVLCNM